MIKFVTPYFNISSQTARNDSSLKLLPISTQAISKRKVMPAETPAKHSEGSAQEMKRSKAIGPVKDRIPLFITPPTPPEFETGKLQLGDEGGSDMSSDIKRQLLDGYEPCRSRSQPNEGPDTGNHPLIDLPSSSLIDSQVDDRYKQPRPQGGATSESARASGDSSEPLLVDVGLNRSSSKSTIDYGDAAAKMWPETTSNIPLRNTNPSKIPMSQAELQQHPIMHPTTKQPTQLEGLLGRTSTPRHELGSSSSLMPLLTLSPDRSSILIDIVQDPDDTPDVKSSSGPHHGPAQPVRVESDLLHLGVPWFSSEVEDKADEPEAELNMRFPPLGTQQEGAWAIRTDDDDGFDQPIHFQVKILPLS